MNRREAIAALVSMPEVARISVARIKPTDVLVVECDQRLTQEMCERLKSRLLHVWPDQKIVVLDSSLRLKVVEGK